jgi:hypothetical protein
MRSAWLADEGGQSIDSNLQKVIQIAYHFIENFNVPHYHLIPLPDQQFLQIPISSDEITLFLTLILRKLGDTRSANFTEQHLQILNQCKLVSDSVINQVLDLKVEDYQSPDQMSMESSLCDD